MKDARGRLKEGAARSLFFERPLNFRGPVCYPSNMPEHKLRSTDRKLPLIGPLVIVAAIALIIVIASLLGGVQPHRAPPAVAPPPTPAPQIPALPPPPLTRSELVQAAQASASAYATGAAGSKAKSPLVGRAFVVRIPFGCDGPGAAPAAAQASVEFDAATGAVKLVARPSVWTSLPGVQELPNAKSVDTVEGFWIPRPWADSETCPPKRDRPLPATPTPPAAQTIGLARIFTEGDSRVSARGDRPYERTFKVPKDDTSRLGHAYALVLEGRLTGFGDGQVTHCWSESDDHRPVCLFSVEYDRVAFEDTVTGEVLAEWKD